MSEADTLYRFAASGEYSATEEAIFTSAANEIRALRAALMPFAKQSAQYDWRRGTTFKHYDGKEYNDDDARVLLDALTAVPTKGRYLTLGDFRRAADLLLVP